MNLQPPRNEAGGRQYLILATMALQVGYFALRCLTLNFESTAAALYSLIVVAAEISVGVSFALVLFELWRPKSRAAVDATNRATTDVVLVVRDEEIALIRASLAACERLESPHETIILDCRGRSEVRAAAEESGVAYFQPIPYCSTRGQALDAVLTRVAGELVAVFDAGLIPEVDFLAKTTLHLADPDLAVVQTSIVAPMVLTDASMRGRVELTPRNGDPLQRERQIGRNHWNAATLLGSAFLVRRSALEDVGGFGPGDGETLRLSIKLQENGWRTDYLDAPLCVDFTSRDAANVLGWNAEGKASDFAASLDSTPWLKPGLSTPQKLCYLSTFLRSLSPVFRSALYLAPLPALAFGVFPMASSWRIEIATSAIVYHLSLALVRRFLTRGRVGVVSYELNAIAEVWTSCFCLFATTVSRFHRRREYGRHAVVHQATGSASPHVVFAGATAASVFWAWMGPTFGVSGARELIAPTLIALWNAGLSLVAIERILAKWERRRHERRSALLSVQYDVPGETNLGGLGLAFDLSESGLGLVVYHPFSMGQSIFMTLEGPDGKMRLQGEIRSVRRVGTGVTPGLERPAAYRVGVLLTRATPQQRDMLLHWSALQAARDVKGSLYDESLRNLWERSSLGRHGRRRLHAPMLLGGELDDAEAWGSVTQEVGSHGFRVISRHSLDKDSELRFAMATPFGPASGWVRLQRELPLTEGATPILAQEFAFTIWDNGSEGVVQRMASPRRRDAAISDALSPFGPAPKLPLRTYAVAASVWFFLATPLLSMSFFHAHAPEILLGRLAHSNETPTPSELDELETLSRTELASDAASTERLEMLYRVTSRVPGRREPVRLAQAIAERQPRNPQWRLRWGEGIAAAGLHVDAELRFREAMQLTSDDDFRLKTAIQAARGRNFAAAGNWSEAVTSFTQALLLAPENLSLRRALASALVNAGRPEEARDYAEVPAPKATPPAARPTVAPSPKLSPTPRTAGVAEENPPKLVIANAPKPSILKSVPRSPKRPTVGWSAVQSQTSKALASTSSFLVDSAAQAINAVSFDPNSMALAVDVWEAERLQASGESQKAKSKYLQLMNSPAISGPRNTAIRGRLISGYFTSASKLKSTPGLVEEARQVSTKLLNDPDSPFGAVSIAAGFFEQNGDVVETIALLDRAYRLNPKDAAVAERFAKILESAGEYERAAEVLKSLLGDIASAP